MKITKHVKVDNNDFADECYKIKQYQGVNSSLEFDEWAIHLNIAEHVKIGKYYVPTPWGDVSYYGMFISRTAPAAVKSMLLLRWA